jgi:hypothetical protein
VSALLLMLLQVLVDGKNFQAGMVDYNKALELLPEDAELTTRARLIAGVCMRPTRTPLARRAHLAEPPGPGGWRLAARAHELRWRCDAKHQPPWRRRARAGA